MDLIEIGVSALITGLTVFLSGWVMFKIAKNNVKEEFLTFLGSDEGQKVIYGLGYLAAQGAKSGFGMKNSGGKFGLKDIMMNIAGKWLEKSGMFGQPAETEPYERRNITPRLKNQNSPLPE